MSKQSFDICLTGNGLSPESVCLSDLAEFLSNTEKAILSAADDQRISEGKPIVSLVSIHKGSCNLTLAVDSELIPAACRITKAVSEAKFNELPILAWQALFSMSKFVAKRGWSLLIPSNTSLKLKKAVISAEQPVPEPDTFAAQGTTTIYGRCLRVGGVEPKVEVQLADGSTRLHVSVSESMARTLARRLYEQVGLEGEAVWDTKTWRITSFRAIRMLDYQPTSLIAAFEGLAQIAGKRWQGVNGDEHVESLRVGTEESR